ncbi:MAG: signal peptidase I [Thermacetogeniaceae bacterium]
MLLIVVMLAVGYMAAEAGLAGDEPGYVPGIWRYKLVVILSDSMRPAIKAGDAIVIDSKANARLKSGDIITYRFSDGKTLLTHRIAATRREGGQVVYYTKGDANNVMDGGAVLRGDIVGKYLFRIPSGGLLLTFVHTKEGFALLVLFPLIAAFCLEFRGIFVKRASGKIQP